MTGARWAWAEVDLAAVAHNVGVLRRAAAPADVWAVVKADGYGHGAVPVARAALDAGATGLCVALVQEGIELRAAGIRAPVLVLSEQPGDQLDALVANGLSATVYSAAYLAELVEASRRAGSDVVPVHVKVDTGMHRVGVAPERALDLAALVAAAPGVHLAGVFTHLACADEPEHLANTRQLGAFEVVLDALADAHVEPGLIHAANSAGALALPRSRRHLVRAGIAIYGIEPGIGVRHLVTQLRPALRLVSRVSLVKRLHAGAGISYGWRAVLDRDATIATVPVGYADGVPRRLSPGADVLIGGRRRPIVGRITMDQFMVDLGDGTAEVGDEVVLLGRQGDEEIRVEEWAERLGTIGYEIVCGISRRVPRRHVSAGQ